MTEKGQQIIALRKKGKTYGEIEKILKLPKSTVAWWLRSVKIPKYLQQKILIRSKKKWSRNITNFNKIYGKIRSKTAAKTREAFIEKASKEIKGFSKKDLRLVGTALYWAEGNTKNRNRIQFSNSNPLMIKVAMQFFKESCKIPKDRISARIHIYPRTDNAKALSFWSKLTKLPKDNFKPVQVQISRASKGKRPFNTLPYGTLHLTVSNTELACKIKGWIRGISEQI